MKFPWNRVDKGADNECWEISTRGSQRYGRVYQGSETKLAHRTVYEIEVGEIGDKSVLHTCDNPKCVNPNHLFLGTQSDNMQDMYDKGRREPLRGSENPESKLTEEMVKEIRQRYEDGETQTALCEEYPCGRSMVGQIVRREAWTHI